MPLSLNEDSHSNPCYTSCFLSWSCTPVLARCVPRGHRTGLAHSGSFIKTLSIWFICSAAVPDGRAAAYTSQASVTPARSSRGQDFPLVQARSLLCSSKIPSRVNPAAPAAPGSPNAPLSVPCGSPCSQLRALVSEQPLSLRVLIPKTRLLSSGPKPSHPSPRRRPQRITSVIWPAKVHSPGTEVTLQPGPLSLPDFILAAVPRRTEKVTAGEGSQSKGPNPSLRGYG